jgi:subtilisin
MLRQTDTVSRRDVLKATAGSFAALSTTGLAAAKPDDTVEVNVGFNSERGRSAALDAAEEVLREFEFDAVTIRGRKETVTGLESNPTIRYVEENGTMHALAETLPWGIDRVDAEVAHANGETGDGADVAIIDTGIDATHPDLEPNLGEGRAFTGGVESSNWQDDNGHGTHCAGIADAVDNDRGVVGVSTEATLHAVKVLTASGSGTTSDVAAGIEYVGDQGWDVGSLSLGGGGSTETLKDAVQYAHEQGVLLVAAAGNDGPCEDCVGYPAGYPEVVAVSSTDENDDLSDFSSTGPEVELAAPGSNVYSTYVGGYATLSGTSMACPHVSGASGQLMANGYSNQKARKRLKSTAEDVGLASNEQGAGLLDVAAALGLDSTDN